MARFERLTVYNRLLQEGVVPLFFHGDLETSQSIVAALATGGTKIIEFTNRGDFALEVFTGLVKYAASAFPDVILGIGSVDDAPTAAMFIAMGANFIVGPTLNPEIARLCNRHKIPYMPGCMTVSEIALAEELGAEIIKLFPGNVGGPEFVKAVKAPRPWTRIMPTGGVGLDEASLKAWFDAGVACVGMGSNLVKSDWVKAGNFTAIENAARTAVELVQKVRSK